MRTPRRENLEEVREQVRTLIVNFEVPHFQLCSPFVLNLKKSYQTKSSREGTNQIPPQGKMKHHEVFVGHYIFAFILTTIVIFKRDFKENDGSDFISISKRPQ